MFAFDILCPTVLRAICWADRPRTTVLSPLKAEPIFYTFLSSSADIADSLNAAPAGAYVGSAWRRVSRFRL